MMTSGPPDPAPSDSTVETRRRQRTFLAALLPIYRFQTPSVIAMDFCSHVGDRAAWIVANPTQAHVPNGWCEHGHKAERQAGVRSVSRLAGSCHCAVNGWSVRGL
ncbi:hypothetical protein C8Q80DRAFT_1133089 [Daedaleopsis nitida]|nr:hypothetical protein C8Q80DRAFT_1133089 [Daedaleopsis nitida]